MYDDEEWSWSDERREIITGHRMEFEEFLERKGMYDAYVDEENEMEEEDKIYLQEEYIKEWRYSLESFCDGGRR